MRLTVGVQADPEGVEQETIGNLSYVKEMNIGFKVNRWSLP